MKKKYIFGGIFILFGVILALLPTKNAPVCHVEEGAKMMKCFWTGRALFGTGILLAVLNIFFCITKSAQIGIAVSNILIALYAAAVPTVLIGTCKMPTMMCNAHTKPAVFLVAGLFIIANAVYLVLARKER